MAICGRCQREMAGNVKRLFNPNEVFSVVCKKYGVTLEELTGRCREQHVVTARQEAYYEMRKQSGWSYPRIGRLFNRDHATVISGARVHQERWDVRREFQIS